MPKEVELTENDVRVLELLKTLKRNFDGKYAKNELKVCIRKGLRFKGCFRLMHIE